MARRYVRKWTSDTRAERERFERRQREHFARTHCSRCDARLIRERDSIIDDGGKRIPTAWCASCRGVPNTADCELGRAAE